MNDGGAKPLALLQKPVLAIDASANRRDELLLEIAALNSMGQIDDWAVRGLPAKNTLHAADALLIEDAFRKKSPNCSLCLNVKATPLSRKCRRHPRPHASEAQTCTARHKLPDFEHYAVTPRPRRLRDKLHREFVAAQPCVVCGRQPSDAHHLRFTQPRALGRKVSDEFTVPLCRMHHREIHRTVKEQHWWSRVGIDPVPIADKLWAQTHPSVSKSPAHIQADTFSAQSTAAP